MITINFKILFLLLNLGFFFQKFPVIKFSLVDMQTNKTIKICDSIILSNSSDRFIYKNIQINSDKEYKIKDIKPNNYKIEIFCPNYKIFTKEIIINYANPQLFQFELQPINWTPMRDSVFGYRIIEKMDGYNFKVKTIVNYNKSGLARLADTIPCDCKIQILKSNGDTHIEKKIIRVFWLIYQEGESEIEYSVKCQNICDLYSTRGSFIYLINNKTTQFRIPNKK